MNEIDVNKEMEKYLGRGFSEDQLEEIRIGIEDGVNVSKYARLDLPPAEMAYWRKDLYAQLQENYKEEVKEKIYEERSEEKKLADKKKRRELAYIALVLFIISAVGFLLFIAKLI